MKYILRLQNEPRIVLVFLV